MISWIDFRRCSMASSVMLGSGVPVSAQAVLASDQGMSFRILRIRTSYFKASWYFLTSTFFSFAIFWTFVSFADGEQWGRSGYTRFEGINDLFVLEHLPHLCDCRFTVEFNASLIKRFNDIVESLHEFWVFGEGIEDLFGVLVGENEFGIHMAQRFVHPGISSSLKWRPLSLTRYEDRGPSETF
jgi:hypothetical protein